MKTPKMKGPSDRELLAEEDRKAEADKRTRALAEENAVAAAAKQADATARQAGKVGMRSLLSGDWSGFQRGGDLGPQS